MLCGYKQPPYALEHANAAWCKLTGFTPLMIKGSYGLEILKVFLLSHSLLIMTSHNRSEQQHRSPLQMSLSISFWFNYTLTHTIMCCLFCVARLYSRTSFMYFCAHKQTYNYTTIAGPAHWRECCRKSVGHKRKTNYCHPLHWYIYTHLKAVAIFFFHLLQKIIICALKSTWTQKMKNTV